MTFLELCQRTAREGGVEGTVSSVANQVGMNRKIVDWVRDAWTELQTMRDWSFMRGEMNATLEGERQGYYITALPAGAPPDARGLGVEDFEEFAMSRLFASDADGNYAIRLIEYGAFREQTLGQVVQDQRPASATVGPGYTLVFNARPILSTTLQADYRKRATVLLADTDTPAMNADWHMAIVYKALRDYAEHEESPEIQRRARRKFAGVFNEMCIVELPTFTIPASPLAWGRRDA